MKIQSFLYERLLRPLLFFLEPESAHSVAMIGLKFYSANPWLMNLLAVAPDTASQRNLFGLSFPNPVGLAAGFDKNAEALPAWAALGFGFIEAGTITAKGQPGNPQPRIFRLPELKALINRMGFNNDGSEAVGLRLGRLKSSGRWPAVPVGINIGKTKITPLEEAAADYCFSFRTLFSFADYFVLNVSSPNTPGLRSLQEKDALDDLFSAVQKINRELSEQSPIKPVLVKIAPDLTFTQIDEILELISRNSISGIIATNTTLDQSGVPETERRQGGLSGLPLRQRSTEIICHIAKNSPSTPIIASGGIFDGPSAREKMDAGASLVQIYTGFIYQGPGVVKEIRKHLLTDTV